MPTETAEMNTGNRVRLSAAQVEQLTGIIQNLPVPDEVKENLLRRLGEGDASVVQDIMSATHGYPDTPLVFGPEVKFKLGVIAAIKRFKKKKTHNRTTYERLEAMRELARDLSIVYGRPEVKVAAVCLVEDETADSRSSFYHRKTDTIVMLEKLSIITLLHEFAHAIGKDEVGAVRWSVTLFKRIWPERFEMLQPDGHTLIMPNGITEDGDEVVELPESPAAVNPAPADAMTGTSDPDAEEDEALGLLDDDEDEEEDDGEWIDEEFDDMPDDEGEDVEPEEYTTPPPRRRRTKDKTPKPKPKAKKKAPSSKPKPKRKPKQRR